MPAAEIITIGTELLLGEAVDTNTRYIARALRDAGINLFRTSTIGDNVQRIAEVIREGLSRAEIIITTGGLGPTVDDPTRDAVALAVGVETEFRPELWEQIEERFHVYGRTPTENNRRQAYVPAGAIAITNPVGTAPAFIVETGHHAIISLPGVPREMEHLMQTEVLPYLRKRYQLTGIIKTRLLHTAGVGESQIDERISDLEYLSNPTVGLAAHAGQVDVRITAKADTLEEADRLIQEVEAELRNRLGTWIYGVDKETLEGVALQNIAQHGWRLMLIEAGFDGLFVRRLASVGQSFAGGEILAELPTLKHLMELLRKIASENPATLAFGAVLKKGGGQQALQMAYVSPTEERNFTRSFGGPPLLAPQWGINLCLDKIRKIEARQELAADL